MSVGSAKLFTNPALPIAVPAGSSGQVAVNVKAYQVSPGFLAPAGHDAVEEAVKALRTVGPDEQVRIRGLGNIGKKQLDGLVTVVKRGKEPTDSDQYFLFTITTGMQVLKIQEVAIFGGDSPAQRRLTATMNA